jgi:hypothetical protein
VLIWRMLGDVAGNQVLHMLARCIFYFQLQSDAVSLERILEPLPDVLRGHMCDLALAVCDGVARAPCGHPVRGHRPQLTVFFRPCAIPDPVCHAPIPRQGPTHRCGCHLATGQQPQRDRDDCCPRARRLFLQAGSAALVGAPAMLRGPRRPGGGMLAGAVAGFA